MTVLVFVMAGLATYRLARFSIKDDGPFNVFGRWRALCGVVDGVEPKAGSMADQQAFQRESRRRVRAASCR